MADRWPVATVFRVSGGWVGLARSERGLCRSTLPEASREKALQHIGPGATLVAAEEDPLLSKAAALVKAYFAGEAARFELPVDLSGVPDFTRSVLLECHKIPYGSTASYGELARRVGNPRAARAVGQAMRRNPLPPIIPCHRVVGSDGSLVGFAGGTEGLPLKRALLDRERPG